MIEMKETSYTLSESEVNMLWTVAMLARLGSEHYQLTQRPVKGYQGEVKELPYATPHAHEFRALAEQYVLARAAIPKTETCSVEIQPEGGAVVKVKRPR